MGDELDFLQRSMTASDKAMRLKTSRDVFRRHTLNDPDFVAEHMGAI